MSLLAAIRDGREVAETSGTPYPHLTRPQRAFVESDLDVTVWWGANGIGKSVTAAELLTRGVEGALPWQSGPGPRTWIITGQTWDQIGVTLRHFMSGRGSGYLRPGIRFEAGRMRGQRSAVWDIVAGPGRGGEIRGATFTAGAQNIAGPRAEGIISDEPLPEGIYNELIGRGFGRRGRLYITYTPTLGTTQRLDYLWSQVDDPEIPDVGEICTPLSLDAVTPRGGPLEIPWATAAEIEAFARKLSPVERQMRLGLSRVPRFDQTYFGDLWGSHLVGECSPPAGTAVGVGIDHGSRPGAERIVLVAVDGRTILARVWVLDEWSGTSKQGASAVAQAILDMLERNGLTLADVDYWVGDRAHRGDRKGGAISNQRVKEALARLQGLDVRTRGWHQKLPVPLQRLWPPRKYLASDYEGMATLRRLMMREEDSPPQVLISPRCEHLHQDIQLWDGTRTSPHKDGLDAFRYPVVAMIEPGWRRAA